MKRILLILIPCLFMLACNTGQKRQQENQVVIHFASESDMLNPLMLKTEYSVYIVRIIFQSLMFPDYKTLELMPVLAESRPKLEVVNEKLHITYRIRPEAKWDNNTPITAKDAEFSLKVLKNPKVEAQRTRLYLETIDSMIFYPDNPRQFTLVCKDIYFRAEVMSGDFIMLPEYVYDPKGLLKEFTVHQLNNPTEELMNNPKLAEFANDFSNEKFQREKGFVVGSGAYELDSWETGKRIVLKRKQNWWGDAVKEKNMFFDAYPDKLIYEIIPDYTTAEVAMKGGKIDVMFRIPPKDFVKDLMASEDFHNRFFLFTPPMFLYNFFAINNRLPKFSDKNVRKALARLVNAPKIIETVYYNRAQQTVGPVNPMQKEYNAKLNPYEYSPQQAKQLLALAGWKDSNGNGTLDKVIQGKLTEFTMDLIYNSGNTQREAICLMFQEEARKIGIKVNVQPLEFSVMTGKLGGYDFEMACAGVSSSHLPFDYKQQWHTSSANGGSNVFGFGTAQTDSIIDSIRKELDEDKRIKMSRQLQEIIYEEVPCIFLFVEQDRIAISKKFKNADVYSMKPGFWEPGFQPADH